MSELNFHQYDVVVVGAGFSGAVMAERFASQQNKKVLVIEQRTHVAGNCYDYINEHGILVHHYGPHLFHTAKENVWQYLSQFTDWHPYEHKVLSRVNGKLVPLPFNLNTLHMLFPSEQAAKIETLLVENYGFGAKIPILELRETDEPLLQELAEFIYQKFFVNYTTKQWGCKPEDISPAVTARVPVLVSRDDRYFHDKYQAIPAQGYTALISNIIDHANIDVMLDKDILPHLNMDIASKQIYFNGAVFNGPVVFTGMLDHLFNFEYGELPYRSLQFDFETVNQPEFQPGTTVNYPNEEAFTRITEFKHILPVESEATTIVREYPQDYDRHDSEKNIPYYPVFNDQNQQAFQCYRELAMQFENLITVGRLANYRYFNMDDAVNNALEVFQQLQAQSKGEVSVHG